MHILPVEMWATGEALVSCPFSVLESRLTGPNALTAIFIPCSHDLTQIGEVGMFHSTRERAEQQSGPPSRDL